MAKLGVVLVQGITGAPTPLLRYAFCHLKFPLDTCYYWWWCSCKGGGAGGLWLQSGKAFNDHQQQFQQQQQQVCWQNWGGRMFLVEGVVLV
jgi:hypothetical protein